MSAVRTALLAAALGMAVTLGACGSASRSASSDPTGRESTTTVTTGAPATTGRPPVAGATITIHDFSFGRAISVRPGATVSVHNADPTTHSLSSDTGAFDAGDSVPAGSTHTFTAPAKPGTYAFHCNFHAEMHGTLIVTG